MGLLSFFIPFFFFNKTFLELLKPTNIFTIFISFSRKRLAGFLKALNSARKESWDLFC